MFLKSSVVCNGSFVNSECDLLYSRLLPVKLVGKLLTSAWMSAIGINSHSWTRGFVSSILVVGFGIWLKSAPLLLVRQAFFDKGQGDLDL